MLAVIDYAVSGEGSLVERLQARTVKSEGRGYHLVELQAYARWKPWQLQQGCFVRGAYFSLDNESQDHGVDVDAADLRVWKHKGQHFVDAGQGSGADVNHRFDKDVRAVRVVCESDFSVYGPIKRSIVQ